MTEQRVSTAEVLDAIARERRRLRAAVRALGDRATTAAIDMPAWVVGVPGRPSGDEWNRRVVEHYRDVPLERVQADFDRVVDALIERAAKVTA